MIIKAVLLPEKNEKEVYLQESSTAEGVLKALDLNPDIVVIVRNNSLIPIDEKLKDKDVLKIVRVVSGG